MSKSLLVVLLSLVTLSAAAQRRDLGRMAYNIADLVSSEAEYLTQQEKKQIRVRLKEIRKIVNGNFQPTPLPRREAIYRAECQVDDDPSFDFGQGNAGEVRGSIDEMGRECSVRAQATFGTANSSFGLKNVELVSAPSHFISIDCWIDDDPSFDMGQTRVGFLSGRDTSHVLAQCEKVATMIYGSKGSAGLKFN